MYFLKYLMTLIWGLCRWFSSTLSLRVSGYCESRGWKRIHDRNRDDFKLKWCETKSASNYSNFREGRHMFSVRDLWQLPVLTPLRSSAVGPRWAAVVPDPQQRRPHHQDRPLVQPARLRACERQSRPRPAAQVRWAAPALPKPVFSLGVLARSRCSKWP